MKILPTAKDFPRRISEILNVKFQFYQNEATRDYYYLFFCCFFTNLYRQQKCFYWELKWQKTFLAERNTRRKFLKNNEYSNSMKIFLRQKFFSPKFSPLRYHHHFFVRLTFLGEEKIRCVHWYMEEFRRNVIAVQFMD